MQYCPNPKNLSAKKGWNRQGEMGNLCQNLDLSLRPSSVQTHANKLSVRVTARGLH